MEKWESIFKDYQKGVKWDLLVKKHKTSKRTISKALSYFEGKIKTESENQGNINDYFSNNNNEKVKSAMQSSYKSINGENETDLNLKRTEKTIEMLKSMNNLTRLRILILLIAYQELSLGKISKKLGLSKSTASRHLKALMKTDVIKIRKEKVRGPQRKQYFTFSRNLLEMTMLSSSKLRTIPVEKALEARMMDFKNDQLLLEILGDVLGDVNQYYDLLGKNVEKFPPQDNNTLERMFSPQNICRLSLWSLTEQKFEVFKDRYIEFLKTVSEDFKNLPEQDKSNSDIEYPYFIWHIIFPIKRIYERVG